MSGHTTELLLHERTSELHRVEDSLYDSKQQLADLTALWERAILAGVIVEKHPHPHDDNWQITEEAHRRVWGDAGDWTRLSLGGERAAGYQTFATALAALPAALDALEDK